MDMGSGAGDKSKMNYGFMSGIINKTRENRKKSQC